MTIPDSFILGYIVAFFAADIWLKAEVLPAMVRLDMLLLLYRGISYRQRRDDLQIIVLGLFLIVVAAGILAYGIGALQTVGWLPMAGLHAFDISSWFNWSAWYGEIVQGVFNITPTPTVLQLLCWLAYLVVVLTVFLRPVKPAAPQPHGDGGTNGGEQREGDGAQHHGDRQRQDGRWFEVDEEAEERCRDGQRQAGRQPVGHRLGQRHHLEGDGPHGHDVERAILIVLLEDAVGGEQHRQQQRDPQRAGCDARQQRLVRTDADGQQHHDGEEEAKCRADTTTLPHGKSEVALDEGEDQLHAPLPKSRRRSGSRPSGTWVAAMIMPP